VIRPWRIRVRYGKGGGLVFFQDFEAVLPRRFLTKRGARRVATWWEADFEGRRRDHTAVVLVDVVHRRELASSWTP